MRMVDTLPQDSNIKIADFGFSNMYQANQLMNTFAGTVNYAPPGHLHVAMSLHELIELVCRDRSQRALSRTAG